MKQYRAKIDTPWGKKGKIIKDTFYTIQIIDGIPIVCDYLTEYFPEMFEEIEERSDADFLEEEIYQTLVIKDASSRYLANKLLSENAINPKWLKKLKEK